MGIRDLYEKGMQDFVKRRNDELKKTKKKSLTPPKKQSK